MNAAPTVIPRKAPDFRLSDADLPKYWLDGDAFKSRFFDAMQLLFPNGEKFFINCVRDYRDQVTDPLLQQQAKDFTYQEGQHAMAHMQFNERLREQGVEVDRILDHQDHIENEVFRKKFSKGFTLGMTAAGEHLTAIMCHGFFRAGVMDKADARVRALYAWHAIEELEHKAVAFDVMTKVAKVSYLTRIASFLFVSVMFPIHVFLIMGHMLKVDGARNRLSLWLKGLWWLYGWNGLYPRIMGHYFSYFRPGFHPWQHDDTTLHAQWCQSYERHNGDAIKAGNDVMAYALAAA
ncbi:MAG: metal-dependent hydrolase [Pseudomonadota bacterium]